MATAAGEMRRLQKAQALEARWLRAGETPLFARLGFPLAVDHPDCVFEENVAVRDALLAELLSGKVRPLPNPAILGGAGENNDILISEVDRYNLPLRTVLSSGTGLMRSDPYYPPEFLQHFYATHYRGLYRGRVHSEEQFFAEQVTHGQRILRRVSERLPEGKRRVLDVGCGMGGVLVPFKEEGHQTFGCDYGADYAQRGRRMGLDIRVGGLEAVADAGPFDVIVASHVLEHSMDPIGFARAMAGLLSEGGILYVEVPGIFYIQKFWDADLLVYLQNAHAWHFTAPTLTALLSHAGLAVDFVDESIWCVARRQEGMAILPALDGPRVLEELHRLERGLAAKSPKSAEG